MTDDERRRLELSDFLITRRARVSPSEAGLTVGARRRTPGLRREEVAELAGVGVTWYTWLEQGRDIRVSRRMLENLVRVFRLSAIEKSQLLLLALGETPAETILETVTPALQRMLENFTEAPAFITNCRFEVLAWNKPTSAVILDYGAVPVRERNVVWQMFTNPAMRTLRVGWQEYARSLLSKFRREYGRYVWDVAFTELVERLKTASPEFREWWPLHDIQPGSAGVHRFNHPEVGLIVLEHTVFKVLDHPDVKLVVHTPMPEANSRAKIRKLLNALPPSMAREDGSASKSDRKNRFASDAARTRNSASKNKQ